MSSLEKCLFKYSFAWFSSKFFRGSLFLHHVNSTFLKPVSFEEKILWFFSLASICSRWLTSDGLLRKSMSGIPHLYRLQQWMCMKDLAAGIHLDLMVH